MAELIAKAQALEALQSWQLGLNSYNYRMVELGTKG